MIKNIKVFMQTIYKCSRNKLAGEQSNRYFGAQWASGLTKARALGCKIPPLKIHILGLDHAFK